MELVEETPDKKLLSHFVLRLLVLESISHHMLHNKAKIDGTLLRIERLPHYRTIKPPLQEGKH